MDTTIDLSLAHRPDLSDRRVVIVGGTGSVGEGVVRAWLAAGAEAIVPSRTQGRVDQFTGVLGEAATDKLHFVVGDYTSFDAAQELAEQIEAECGPVTDVVASIGGWWMGKNLWEISQAEWDRYFVGLTTAHVAQVRAWIPRLPEHGSYQLILGGSATQPVPGSSIINMEQAALLMMRQVLSAEAGDQRRVTAAVLGPVKTRLRHWVESEWVSADEVGLLTTGVAADPTASATDYELSTTAQMIAQLRGLGVYPQEGGEAK
ncbi:SDR family NAD(P)-dependent oxidoreductase [Galactobacter valiniphilus]|uniref:SDR family NAD(P)-dependent oxidoreductase n=1 Tax=Galactobacter valiniphilus TaxID=2676122 RepID=UPI003736A49A